MNHAFPGDVVRQARKGLEAYDSAAFMIEEIDHICRQEPAFAGTVSKRQVLGCPFGQFGNRGDAVEPFGAFEGFFEGTAIPFDDVSAEGVFEIFLEGAIHVFTLEMAVQGSIEEEIKHAARFCFASIGFNRMDDVVRCDGGEFDVDFSDDTDSRAPFDVGEGQPFEIFDDPGEVFRILAVGFAFQDGFGRFFLPGAVEGFRAARFFFIGSGPIEAHLEGIAIDYCLDESDAKACGEFEARLGFEALGIQGNDRNLGESCFVQCFMDESDVVGSSAHAAGLAHHEGCLVQVIHARFQGPEEGTDGNDGGIAGIIIDAGKAFVDIRVDWGQHMDVVAIGSGCSFDQWEVNGGHFRNEDGEVFFHFLGEGGFRIENGSGFCIFFHSFFDGGFEGTETDSYGSQVQTLIDLEAGIESSPFAHDFLDLIGDDRIQTAAERVQFYQFQIGMAGDVVGCFIQTAVPGPLIHDAEIREFSAHHGYAVFGKDGHTQLIDEVRNGMVHRGVHMIGSAGENDADEVFFFDFFQDPFRFLIQFLFVFLFCPAAFANGRIDFITFDAKGFEEFLQPSVQGIGMEGQEGMVESGFVFRKDFVHVRLDIFRIGGYHGAVITVRGSFFRPFINAGIPDEVGMPFGKVIDMGMSQFGREAFGVGWNGFHGFCRNVSELFRGKKDAIAQFREESMPEGIIFVEIHGPRDAYGAAGGLFGREGPAMENLVIFPAVNIGQGRVGRGLAGEHDGSSPFAAVSGYESPAVIEFRDGDHAVISAARAPFHFIGVGEGCQFFRGDQGGNMAFGAGIFRDEGNPVSSHEACHIGTDHMAVQKFFESPEDRIIIERTALDDHLISKVRRLAETDDFIEGIFDDGVGKAGRNIGHGNAVFLGFPDTGIHENRAAGSQVYGVGGFQGNLREGLDIHAQGLGKGIQEGAAARRAGFIQKDFIHGSIFDAAAFHILSADIQNGGYVGKEMLRPAIMSHGFHFTDIGLEGPFDQFFAITGDAGAGNGYAFRKLCVEVGEDFSRSGERRAFISCVVFVKNISIPIEEDRFNGGRAGIDAEPYGAFCFGNIGPGCMETAVTVYEFSVFFFIDKEGVQRFGNAEIHVFFLFHFRKPGVQVERLVMAGRNSGTDGYIQFPMVRDDHIFISDVQGLLEPFAESGLESERPAEEGHFSVHRPPAGETGNSLVHHGLEDGKGDIFMGNAFIQESLDIGLRKNAAAGSDGVNLLCLRSQLTETGSIYGKKGSHTVDKSSRTPGTGPVHPLIHAISKVGDFFIFPAQFDDHIRIGMESLDRFRLRQDFLGKRKAHEPGKSHTAGPGNGCGDAAAGEFLL